MKENSNETIYTARKLTNFWQGGTRGFASTGNVSQAGTWANKKLTRTGEGKVHKKIRKKRAMGGRWSKGRWERRTTTGDSRMRPNSRLTCIQRFDSPQASPLTLFLFRSVSLYSIPLPSPSRSLSTSVWNQDQLPVFPFLSFFPLPFFLPFLLLFFFISVSFLFILRSL